VGFDPYAVLGVPRDATDEQIAQARYRLVRRYHPDVNPDPDAAVHFDEVQRAFHLLSDPAARAEYERARGEPRMARQAGDPGRAATAGRFSVYPGSVDFGVIEPGKAGTRRDVTVRWTGEPAARITSDPGTGWWTVTRTGRLGSLGVVFHLYAQAAAGEPFGRRQAQLSVTVDGTSITVPLAAEVGVVTLPSPAGVAAAWRHPVKWWRTVIVVALLAAAIAGKAVSEIPAHHPGSGGAKASASPSASAAPTATPSASARPATVPRTRKSAVGPGTGYAGSCSAGPILSVCRSPGAAG
jgi:hypothetical protein